MLVCMECHRVGTRVSDFTIISDLQFVNEYNLCVCDKCLIEGYQNKMKEIKKDGNNKEV